MDPIHSSIGFALKRNGVATFRGQFEQVDATLEDGVLTGTAQVDSIKTAIPQLKEHLLSPEFFNAAETPTVTFARPTCGWARTAARRSTETSRSAA